MGRERTEREVFNENRRLLRSYNRDLRTNEREALANARSTQERRQIKQRADNLRAEISPINNERTRSPHTQTGRSPHVKPSSAVLRKEEKERIAEETNTDEVSSGDERVEQPRTIDGFEEERIDIVDALNNPSYRWFLTKFD